MNSNVGISTIRRIGEIFIHVTISTNNYASNGQTLNVSEQAAACEQFIAGLPGAPVAGSYGSPAAPSDIADPKPSGGAPADVVAFAGGLVDAEVTEAAVENHVTEERPAIAAV